MESCYQYDHIHRNFLKKRFLNHSADNDRVGYQYERRHQKILQQKFLNHSVEGDDEEVGKFLRMMDEEDGAEERGVHSGPAIELIGYVAKDQDFFPPSYTVLSFFLEGQSLSRSTFLFVVLPL